MSSAENERQRRLALLGAMSGDPALQNAAEMLTASTRNKKLNLGNGFVYDPDTGETTQDPAYANFVADREAAALQRAESADARRDARLDRQIGAANDRFERGLVGREMNIGPDARQKAAEADRISREAENLFGELGRVQGAISSPKDIAARIAGAVPVAGTGLARVTENALYDDDQLAVKSRARRMEAAMSQAAVGMSLTGFELDARETWSPFASGITQEEAKRRLQNIQSEFADRRDTILNAPRLRPGGAPTAAPPQPTNPSPSRRVRVDAEGNPL